MGRKKLKRFAELKTMPNVVDGRRCEPGWVEGAFGCERPLLLELGCGRGEYTLALARLGQDCGVIGVDKNGARLWKGARRALEEGITNAVFLRATIESLEEHLPAGRVAGIWIPFPDPLPKKRQAKHRLLAPDFLDRYRRLLAPGAALHLKTDDKNLVEYAHASIRSAGGRVVQRCADVTESPAVEPVDVVTTYERRYRAEGRAIHYLRFCLD